MKKINILHVIFTLCLSSSVAFDGLSEWSQQLSCDIVQKCVGDASTETDERLKEMNENFFKLEQRFNSTVDSLKSETQRRLRIMNWKYSRLQIQLRQRRKLSLETDRRLKEMTENYNTLKEQVSSTVDSLQTAEEKVEKLTEKYSQMERDLTLKILEIVAFCPVRYNGKCFRAIVSDMRNVNFPVAETTCENGWKLANIYSRPHYDEVAEYLRHNFPFINFMGVWLGMTYDPTTKKMYLSDGTQTTEKLPWYVGQPANIANYNKMNIVVRKDPNASDQGMVNFPVTALRRGVLCEIAI